MATSTRTGGTAAGTLAKKVASDIRAAISEGHAPAGNPPPTRQQQRNKRGGGRAAATDPSLSFDDADHKLSALRQAAKELTERMHEDAATAKQAFASKASGDAVGGTGLARALAEALEFARGHAEGAQRAIEQHAGGGGGRGGTASSSSQQRGKRAAAAATLRLAVAALIAAASACEHAARWGSKGTDASSAAADAIYEAAGEEMWLAVTEE